MNVPEINARCDGSPYEIGLAQGEALRERILESRKVLAKLEAFRLLKPRWLPYRIFRYFAEQKAQRYLDGALSQHTPEMAKRLNGISQSSGVSQAGLCLLNALEISISLLEDLATEGCTTAGTTGACTAVAIRGSRSATGAPIIAKNFDYLRLVQPLYVLRDCRPSGRFRSLDFTVAPLCGTIDGVNEKGLCITFNYAFTTDYSSPAPPISMAIADALSECSTVAEAAQYIGSRPRSGGGMLMMADADGDIASLELSNTRHYLRRPADGEDMLFHTNVFFSDKMRQVEIARDAVHADRSPAALRGSLVHQSALCRAERLEQLLTGNDALQGDRLAAIMADHGADGEPNGNTVCMHGSYWGTTACLQLSPRSRQIRVSYSPACEADYREFGL